MLVRDWRRHPHIPMWWLRSGFSYLHLSILCRPASGGYQSHGWSDRQSGSRTWCSLMQRVTRAQLIVFLLSPVGNQILCLDLPGRWHVLLPKELVQMECSFCGMI